MTIGGLTSINLPYWGWGYTVIRGSGIAPGSVLQGHSPGVLGGAGAGWTWTIWGDARDRIRVSPVQSKRLTHSALSPPPCILDLYLLTIYVAPVYDLQMILLLEGGGGPGYLFIFSIKP